MFYLLIVIVSQRVKTLDLEFTLIFLSVAINFALASVDLVSWLKVKVLPSADMETFPFDNGYIVPFEYVRT